MHDAKIIEAIVKHRRGQGAVTCIDEPSVGGGESPDVLSWFPPDTGAYETLLDEYKDSRDDVHADGRKAHRQRAGVGDRRVLIISERVCPDGNVGDPILWPWLKAGWGIECLRADGTFDVWHHPRYRATKDRRTEDRLLHDYIRKLEWQVKQQGAPQRNGSAPSGLKPYHHEILDQWLSDSAGLKEIAAILLGCDDRLTKKRAMELAHEALDQGVPGFNVVQSGQDTYLERPQQQEAT